MAPCAPTVGIATSLYHYQVDPYWRTLFESLDYQVRLGGGTRQELPALVHRFENELCLPVKYFLGQVGKLLDQGVDHLFAPLVYSLQEQTFACPKIIMTRDLVRLYFPDCDRLLSPRLFLHYDRQRFPALASAAGELVRPLGCSLSRLGAACDRAEEAQLSFEKALRGSDRTHDEIAGGSPPASSMEPGRPRVLILGHRYSVHNGVLSNDLAVELRRLGLTPCSKEHLPRYGMGVTTRRELDIDLPIYLSEGADIFRAAFYGARARNVDAVIYLAMFNCGFDAAIEDVVSRRLLKGVDKPYLHLVVDEHATKANLITRLEVFRDIVLERKQRPVTPS